MEQDMQESKRIKKEDLDAYIRYYDAKAWDMQKESKVNEEFEHFDESVRQYKLHEEYAYISDLLVDVKFSLEKIETSS